MGIANRRLIGKLGPKKSKSRENAENQFVENSVLLLFLGVENIKLMRKIVLP